MVEQETTALVRRGMIGWVIFDLANVVFAINIASLYFPLWIVDDAGGSDANYAVASGISMAVVFVLAPVVGALTDRTARRLPFLLGFTGVCSLSTLFLGSGGLYASLALFVLANACFLLGLLVYDSLLPVVSTPENRGRVSGYSVTAGFAGSILGIALGGAVLAFDESAKPMVFRLTALVVLLGAIPCILWVREPKRNDGVRLSGRVVRDAATQFRATVQAARACPGVARFLIGRAFYTDATNTLLIFMSIYATKEIGFSDFETQLVLLAGILCGPLGAFWSGSAIDRIGPGRTLRTALAVWLVALCASALIPLFSLPNWLFWIVAPLVGIGMGGTSTTERAYMIRLSPPGQLGQFLGLYALLGRFAAILSPLLWVLVSDLLGLGRPAAVLMLAGFVAISRRVLAPINDTPRTLAETGPISEVVPTGVAPG